MLIGKLGAPKYILRFGVDKFASITVTSFPNCARATPKLIDVVDFPEPPLEEDTLTNTIRNFKKLFYLNVSNFVFKISFLDYFSTSKTMAHFYMQITNYNATHRTSGNAHIFLTNHTRL